MSNFRVAVRAAILSGLLLWPTQSQAGPFSEAETAAVIKAAVVQASPSIVRIETIGGLDVIDGVLAGTGATTGVIVSSDGYIVTSSFNFATKPSSVLVTLPDTQQRLPAEVVAQDDLKRLTLLKVDADNLTVAQAADPEQIQVGQWAIALGRTYDPNLPNVSLGLVSALGRVEGKAIQTDAKISPANYGGPLIDIQGRVMGVLSPLSPQGKSLTDAMNWYDSGIGFAIPLADIMARLDQMKSGETLAAGLMGVSFLGTPPFMTEPIIQEVRPNSPAAQAGLKPKDRILQAAGKPVTTVAVLRQQLGQRYAGDRLSLVVARGEERIETDLVLAEKLEAFHFGWLGVLTDPATTNEDVTGVPVRFVFENSPAQQAGVQKQDLIVSVNQNSIETRDQLYDLMSLQQADQPIELIVLRDGNEVALTVDLIDVPTEIPAEIPTPLLAPDDQSDVKTGEITQQLPDSEQSYKIFVPEDYRPGQPHGCLLWLPVTGRPIDAAEYSEWKRLCRTRGLVLVMPVSSDLQPWSTDDTSWLLETVADAQRRYAINKQQICLVTGGNNPIYPWQLVFENRELFSGFVAFSLPNRFRTPYNEPGEKFSVLLAGSSETDLKIQPKMVELLSTEAFPTTVLEYEAPLTGDDYDRIGRWLEMIGSL